MADSGKWPQPDTPFEDVRNYILSSRDEGVKCPCCERFSKVYRRSITSSMAYALYLIYCHSANTGKKWLHVPSFLSDSVSKNAGATSRGGDWAKLGYWDLLQEHHDVREDGGKHVGWWRITDLGEAFVEGKVKIPKHAVVYNQTLMALDTGELVSFEESLKNRFNYDELMSNVPSNGAAA